MQVVGRGKKGQLKLRSDKHAAQEGELEAKENMLRPAWISGCDSGDWSFALGGETRHVKAVALEKGGKSRIVESWWASRASTKD